MPREYFDDFFPTVTQKTMAWLIIFFNAAVSTAWVGAFDYLSHFLLTFQSNNPLQVLSKCFYKCPNQMWTGAAYESVLGAQYWHRVRLDMHKQVECSARSAFLSWFCTVLFLWLVHWSVQSQMVVVHDTTAWLVHNWLSTVIKRCL